MAKAKKVARVDIKELGFITDIKKDIVTIKGIPHCAYGECLEFESGDSGIVIEFDEEKVVALLIGKDASTAAGGKVISRGDILKIPVSEKLLGRVVTSLASPVDGKPQIESQARQPIFKNAPPILARIPVRESFSTGIKILDSMIPIGKGQRELIIGDRQTGKSTIATDAILNQKGKDVVCIYCWIGGSFSSMAKLIESLSAGGAMDYTTFVAAPASASATEQYLAPYAACTMGEYFMSKGKDVLVVFDNLTKHAWVYRQISLLLGRSPGREAYPGDIFYIHSQLMERAGRLKPEIGGSMTFFPIVDTLQGDLTGYIPSNLVSMTDGQIYTSSALFNEGFKPAIDIGLSVSRIGSKVQSPALKEVSAKLRLEYTQFKELQKLTKLKAKMSEDIIKRIKKGHALTAILRQGANSPVSETEEIIIFYAFDKGFLDDLDDENITKFQEDILDFMRQTRPALVDKIESVKKLTPEVKKGLEAALSAYLAGIKK